MNEQRTVHVESFPHFMVQTTILHNDKAKTVFHLFKIKDLIQIQITSDYIQTLCYDTHSSTLLHPTSVNGVLCHKGKGVESIWRWVWNVRKYGKLSHALYKLIKVTQTDASEHCSYVIM